MTKEQIAEALSQMQRKIDNSKNGGIGIWQNDNGTFSHTHDARRQWKERIGCETDLQFCKEWAR